MRTTLGIPIKGRRVLEHFSYQRWLRDNQLLDSPQADPGSEEVLRTPGYTANNSLKYF